MCGIAGVLYHDTDRPVADAVLREMASVLSHRGPDAEGYWKAPGIGLAHRRLSVIDLSGGDQPIGNEDGSVQVVFNGEIYNYRELQKELVRRGHRFRTESDTEVIVHLYEEYAEDLVVHLRGMFAFALWDARRRRLMLARDRLGIKPLYLYRDQEKVLFGSELKAILAYPGIPRQVEPSAVEDYLAYGFVPGPRSFLAGIERLPPAHVLVVDDGAVSARPQRYWQLDLNPDETLSVEEWIEAIEAKVAETIRLHMRADVPVGAFLSGGFDSSVIVSYAAQWSNGPLQTFSIGFPDDDFSELPYAKAVADRYATRHVEQIVTADVVNMLDELAQYYDEPFADSSAIPTYLVSRLASQSVKVVLSGDGGDEAFGGYSRYAHDLREAELRNRLPLWFRRHVLGPLARVWPKADWLPRPLRAKTRLTNLSLNATSAYANTLSVCRLPMRHRLLSPPIRAALNGHDPEHLIADVPPRWRPGDALAGMIGADVATVLPDDFLVKVDRASMAHGLEVRPPLLDHELFELAARVPSCWKVHRGETKWLFKETFRDRLPRLLWDRPKHGFEMPVDRWFRGPLSSPLRDRLVSRSGRLGELIDLSVANRILDSHVRGSSRHGNLLWALLVLDCWCDTYLESPVQRHSCRFA